MITLLSLLATAEGVSPTSLPGVRIMRASASHPYQPVTYEPSVAIIAQGQKKARLGRDSFTYDPDNYLVLSVPLPFVFKAVGTPQKPMLGLSIQVDPIIVAELSLEIGTQAPTARPTPAIGTASMTFKIHDAAKRLAECLQTPAEAHILGPLIIREIIYRVLRGGQADIIAALAFPQSGFGRIVRVLRHIHRDFARPLKVSTLAREASMSLSTFHTTFKNVTGYSPQRYLQTVRLQKAGVLIAAGGSVAEAARQVGYESPSQFSREFKRLFGRTPKNAVEHKRHNWRT